MALGTTTTAILLGLSGAGAGTVASKMMSKGAGGMDASPAPLPTPANPETSRTNAENVIRQKRAAASRSVYTSPLGLAGEANVARKTLLGQ